MNQRPIKFRAWNTITDDMYDWKDIPNGNEYRLYEVVEKLKSADFILMQFTGLKDKNRKPIYFRDFVKKEGDSRVYEVLMDYNGGALPWHKDQFYSSGGNGVSLDWLPVHMPTGEASKWEIVGNFYESPELLNI